MEIAGLVQNEELFILEVENPKTGKPVGITIQVRSAGSDEAMKVVRAQTDDILGRQQRRKLIDAERVEENELDLAVSYVASWDWGANTYEGKAPDSEPKTIKAIFKKEGWIYAQVVGAARDIANFTKA
jgi:hypothetical protein